LDENFNLKSNRYKTFPPGPVQATPYSLALKFISNPLPVLVEIVNKYGDISHFKFGPKLHVYLINDPYHIENILVKHDSDFIKSPGLRLAKRVLGNGLITSEGEMHNVQRRIVKPAFNRDKISSYGKIILEHCFDYTDSHWKDGMTLNIHKEMTKLSLSIISKILFGSNSLTLSDIDKISNSITTIIEYINKLRIPYLRVIQILPLPSTLRYRQALRGLDRLIYDKIIERRKIIEDMSSSSSSSSDTIGNFMSEKADEPYNQNYADMLSILINCTDDKNTENRGNAQANETALKMSNKQLRDEVMTIFLAGHETTANALTWTLFLISQHPEVESKIMDEIASVAETEKNNHKIIEFEDLPKLKYTEMVLMESMRLYPPSWAIGRQAIKDYVLDDRYVIPSGSVIIMSQYLMHRDARYFSQPERFCPERWSPKFRASIPRFSYFPFGGGPRSCIGEPLAWIEGVIILATVLKKWKVTLEDDAQNIKLQPLVTLRPKCGIRMKLCKRQY
jgi:cytochrome P450